MLRVVYEAADHILGQAVEIREKRGLVEVRIDKYATAHEFTQALNPAVELFMAGCGWFQLWKGEIISIASPGSRLRVEYEVDDLGPGQVVEIRESRGLVGIHVARTATAHEFVRALNPSLEELLAGGQWFQLWKGEIVTMDSPEDPRDGGTVARLHRGQVVQEGAGRPLDGQANAG